VGDVALGDLGELVVGDVCLSGAVLVESFEEFPLFL